MPRCLGRVELVTPGCIVQTEQEALDGAGRWGFKSGVGDPSPECSTGQALTPRHAAALPGIQVDHVCRSTRTPHFPQILLVIPSLHEETVVVLWKERTESERTGFFSGFGSTCVCVLSYVLTLAFSILVFLCYSINFAYMSKYFRGTQTSPITPFYFF